MQWEEEMRASGRKSIRLFLAATAVAGRVWIRGVRPFAFPGKSMSPAVRPGDHFCPL